MVNAMATRTGGQMERKIQLKNDLGTLEDSIFSTTTEKNQIEKKIEAMIMQMSKPVYSLINQSPVYKIT